MLVKPEAAAAQLVQEKKPAEPGPKDGDGEPGTPRTPRNDPTALGTGVKRPEPRPLRRFHGSVRLDPMRLGRDAADIAREVVQHLTALAGSQVEVTLEINAQLADGAGDGLVRTVTENCRTLKFTDYGFEES